MKTLKLAIAAVILACSVQAASAQIRVGVRIGTPPPPPHRVVVVRQPVVVHHPVVVRRAPVRKVYYKTRYRKPVPVHHRVEHVVVVKRRY